MPGDPEQCRLYAARYLEYPSGPKTPHAAHHGYCMAQPGSFDALYCPPKQSLILGTARRGNTGRENHQWPSGTRVLNVEATRTTCQD